MCILKGVFPRKAPHGAGKSKNRTLYLAKDIRFIAHDPLVPTFRQLRVHDRKLKRLVGRREPAAAEVLEKHRPVVRIDHLVRERYPTFQDALRALDDALTLLAVFAAHPATRDVSAERTTLAARLLREFEAYVADVHALDKVRFFFVVVSFPVYFQ